MQVKILIRCRGETTKESLKGRHKTEGIPYQRADICESNKPMLNYREFISEDVYKKYKEKNNGNVRRALERNLGSRMSSEDNREKIKIDQELIDRINSEEHKANLKNKTKYTTPDNDVSSKLRIKKLYP